MRAEILVLALLVGAATWAFRALPLRADLSRLPERGVFARFLAAIGPAAIATLFVASILPMLTLVGGLPLAQGAGLVAVLAVYAATRSVVGATLAGGAAHGLAVWLM